jgi:hypothetical protein
MSATPFPRARGQPGLGAARRRRQAAGEAAALRAPAATVNPPGRGGVPSGAGASVAARWLPPAFSPRPIRP